MQICFCTREKCFGQREQPGYGGAAWDYWRLSKFRAYRDAGKTKFVALFLRYFDMFAYLSFLKRREGCVDHLCVRMKEDGVRTTLLNLETDTNLIYALF